MTTLLVDNVTKQYATRGEPLDVLRGVSLELQSGQNAAIVGPSGSGKSTLLYVVGTLERPTSGAVLIGGQNPLALDEGALADFRNRSIGFVFQEHRLLPQCSTLENVLLPTIARGRPDKAMIQRAHELIDLVGLKDRSDHRPGELSGGERQRAAIARAMIHDPALLLADEPTGNLDRATALRIGELLLDVQQRRKATLLVVTHSLELADMLERRYHLEEGRLREAEA